MVCSVTPPSQALGTSPLSLRSAQSLKRGPSIPRGVNTVPKAVAVSTSLSPPETIDKTDDRRNSLHSRRRSISSTTAVGFDVPKSECFELPPVTFGFQTRCGLPDVPLTIPKHRPQQGLLSRALTTDVPIKTEDLPLRTFSQDAAVGFPDVDTTPLRAVQEKFPVFRTQLLETSYLVAGRAYHGHFRKNGETLLQHCLETACILADLGLDAETVAAGLLHEVLHHKCTSRSQLEEFLHSDVVQLVENVTTLGHVSQVYRDNKDHMDHEDIHQMLLAMKDVRAVLVKLADRVHNMRTISALPHDKQVRMAQETLDVYAVIANRLGVWCLKAELEDLSFAVLHPDEYALLKEQMRHRQDASVLEGIINKVKAMLDVQAVKYEDISGRSKSLYGVYLKLKEGKSTAESVYDAIALRVIVSNKHDCYRVHRAISDVYKSVPGRYKDYIRHPKETNGYQSLHDTVVVEDGMPVEVQLRTHKMHYIAEYGFAAHWKYKEKLDSEAEWLEKQVHYQKWLTTYKLGVYDKKVRPSGSPPTDSSLKSLGLHRLQPGTKQGADVDPFLQNERFKLEPPRTCHQREYVMVQRSTGAKVVEVKPGSSVKDLLAALQLKVNSFNPIRAFVNNREVALHHSLKNSDVVTIEQPVYGRDDDSVGFRYPASAIDDQWYLLAGPVLQPAA